MNPGELNHYITIQTKGDIIEADKDGFENNDWVKFKSMWASQQGLLSYSKAFYSAAAMQAENYVTYKIRYKKGIKAGMRVVDKDAIYYIKLDPIDKDGNRRELYLLCSVTKPAEKEIL
ncbi:phage head closure protein [Clostridium pasteurianum]|uniref:phage head closure protein n=1 Tax=Clostridium pasteurianum TaxID=1501 RepID=UPI002260C884|nr:phage head closure protein [Clostridium pasteurianum]UZW13196.1 phage head closure protein [Clostridium pasteurianum]